MFFVFVADQTKILYYLLDRAYIIYTLRGYWLTDAVTVKFVFMHTNTPKIKPEYYNIFYFSLYFIVASHALDDDQYFQPRL